MAAYAIARKNPADIFVIANINGELTVKRIDMLNGKLCLSAENHNYKPIEINDGSELLIWGVVIYTIHKL